MPKAPYTLVLLRHAKSDWDSDEPDRDRPLARRGLREAPDAGRWIAAHLAVDLAVVSPARRVAETWALVADELPGAVASVVDERIYEASVHDLLDVVRELPVSARTVLLVGHNPGLEALARALTGLVVPMPTSAIAMIALPGPWLEAGQRQGELRASGRPPDADSRRTQP